MDNLLPVPMIHPCPCGSTDISWGNVGFGSHGSDDGKPPFFVRCVRCGREVRTRGNWVVAIREWNRVVDDAD
jgi:hypothetical protein